MANLLFNAQKIIAVPSVNPIPNPQKPKGKGSCTGINVSFLVGTQTTAIPPDFSCEIFQNGISVASFTFTEVAGQNTFIGFAAFDFESTDDISLSLYWTPTPATIVFVDWTTINITLDVTYVTQEQQTNDCPQTGACGAAFTREQLLDLWKSTVDDNYSQQMLLLGEGKGSLEHVTQAFEQLTTVSCAIDRSTQAMFTLPWSGQSGQPGEGARKACVPLSITRTKFINMPIVISETVYAEEVKNDAGDTGPIPVHTGRYYRVRDPVLFNCGVVDVALSTYGEAAKVGYGYNYPLPGEINRLVQVGSNFSNVNAQIVKDAESWFLKSDNEPDVIIPQHVGQYVQINTGPNAGQIYRIRGYSPPQPEATPPTGGTATLDVLVVFECLMFGIPKPGEIVIQATSGAQGIFYGFTNLDSGLQRVVISQRVGSFVLGASPAFDITSQETLTLFFVDPAIPNVGLIINQTPTPDPSASWIILDWVKDIGITVTNPESPSGGRLAFLDEQGSEKNLPRAPGESDDSYRERISKLADLVSPNALRRVANRILAPYGFAGCLREIGQLLYQGFYYDAPFAYDLDCCVVNGVLSGAFIEGEEVLVNVTPDLLPLGTIGVANGYYAGVSGPNFFFSRKGLNSWDGVLNLFVVGKVSGAVLQVSNIVLKRIRPQDRFKTYMNYEEFRAFFMMGVPPLDLGEFGLFYDDYYYAAYDASPFLVYYDGFPTTTAIIYKSIYNALYNAKAGGVGFDLYKEGIGCILFLDIVQ